MKMRQDRREWPVNRTGEEREDLRTVWRPLRCTGHGEEHLASTANGCVLCAESSHDRVQVEDVL
jgi:hypothetical protein